MKDKIEISKTSKPAGREEGHLLKCHRHLLNGIPYSQLLRVRRICSDLSEFKRNAMMLCSHFVRRGYPKHLVRLAYERSLSLNRDELLNKELLKD